MYIRVAVNKWIEAKAILEKLDGYIFRGQSNSEWGLSPTIERHATRHHIPRKNALYHELKILHKFQQEAHHYKSDLPDTSDIFEWLALLQHYGGPTRLLDFTSSFYIAAFFALNNTNDECAIWAINDLPLTFSFSKIIKSNIPLFDDLLDEMKIKVINKQLDQNVVSLSLADVIDSGKAKLIKKNMVISSAPFKINKSMSRQKGLFIVPMNMSESLEKNICDSMEFEYDNLNDSNAKNITSDEILKSSDILKNNNVKLLKLVIPKEAAQEGMYDLVERMNISSKTLFPGLEGFARSFNYNAKA